MHRSLPVWPNYRRRARTLLALASAALLSGCLGVTDQKPTSEVAFDRQAALAKVNDFRRQNGLGAVSYDKRLQAAAERQAAMMASADKMDHNVAGKLPGRIESFGYQWSATAENIGRGYQSFDAALEGWKNSPHHRDNLLNKPARDIGIAAARQATGSTIYWAMIVAAPHVRPTVQPAGPEIRVGGVILGGSLRIP
ncbi:CAP domain-containing protein [Consotaella salsifontis]|nr:CAP domain-containing protein [Consotaella salsifontis]